MPPEKGRRFRALAMQHLVNYVGNRLPNKSAPSNVAPMTVLCGGKVQTLRWARVLFCRVWTFIPVETRGLKSSHHMDPVARPAIHCGVAHNHKGWLAYHEDDGTFEAFIDGKFEETVMPMRKPDAPPWPLPPPGPVPPNPNERGVFEPPLGLPDEPAPIPAPAPIVNTPTRVPRRALSLVGFRSPRGSCLARVIRPPSSPGDVALAPRLQSVLLRQVTLSPGGFPLIRRWIPKMKKIVLRASRSAELASRMRVSATSRVLPVTSMPWPLNVSTPRSSTFSSRMVGWRWTSRATIRRPCVIVVHRNSGRP